MAAPSLQLWNAGAPDAGGAWSYSCGIPGGANRVCIVQILQDGATNGAVTVTGSTNINKLDGTAGWTQIPGPNADGSFPVGGSSEARQFLYIGRVSGTSTPTISGGNSTSEDLFIRSYFFQDVSTGTTLADVIENVTAGTTANGVGTSNTVADTGVTTLGPDRLALNFVAVNDDNAISEFTGETGGDWTLGVAPYADSGGTDGAIGLQIAYPGLAEYENTTTASAGISGDGQAGNERIAESFTPAADNTATSLWVYACKNPVSLPTDDLVLEIQTDSSGSPSGTALGSGVIHPADAGTTLSWLKVSVNIDLSSGTTYWIVFRRTGSGGGWLIGTDNGAVGYTGVAKARSGGSWSFYPSDLPFRVGANAATIDGGTGSIVDSDAWGVVGFALIGTTVSGPATLYGIIQTALTFAKAVAGRKETFGQTATAFTFTKAISGIRKVFGQVAVAFTFGKAVAGARTALGQTITPFTFGKNVAGTRTTFGQIVKVFTVGIVTAGNRLANTLYGIVSAPFTFTKAVTGQRKTFSQIIVPFTFMKDILGKKTTFGQIAAPFTFSKIVSGVRTTFSSTATSITATIITAGYRVGLTLYGIISAPFTFTKSVIGQRKTFGQTTSSYIFSKNIEGFKETFAQLVTPFIFTKNISGVRTTFSSTVTSFTVTIVTAGYRSATTLYGIVSAPFIFTKSIIGQRKTFGQMTIPVVFNKDISGQRKTFSQIVAPFIFTKSVLAKKTTFAQIDAPITFYKEVAGRKQTFAQMAFPINLAFSVVAEVQGIRYGRTEMSLVFGEQTSAQRKTFSQIASSYLFAPAVQGERTTFGQFDRPFVFNKAIIGQRETFGQIDFPIYANIAVSGRRMAFGSLAMGLVFGEQTTGQRKAFGQILSPYILATITQAKRTTFGSLDTDIDFLVDVNTGRVEAFSTLAFEILIGLETAGFVRPKGIILNLAGEIYLGAMPVEAVYTDGQKVWPPTI